MGSDFRCTKRQWCGVLLQKIGKNDPMFPELVSAVQSLKCDSIIFEGEALAYEETGTGKSLKRTIFLFRKRSSESESTVFQMQQKHSRLICFLLTYFILTERTLQQNHMKNAGKFLKKIFPSGKNLKLSERKIIKSTSALENYSVNRWIPGLKE